MPLEGKVVRRSPCGTREARRDLYVRLSWTGYRATKKEENTPATMLSHVTRTLARVVATKRVRVAVKAEEMVETEWDDGVRSAVRRSEIGTMPIRART